MQIVYFPYLHLKDVEEFEIDGIKIWNFKKKSTEYIPDPELRAHVTKLLHSNIRHKKPIEDIAVVSIGDIDFRDFSVSEMQKISIVSRIMFITYLAAHNVKARGMNAGWSLGTSENFSFISQFFQLDNNHIAESSGYIVRMLSGGYEIDEVTFKAPSYVLTPMRFSLDLRLVRYILICRTKNPSLYRRILRSADFMYESYFNDPNVSKNARILMQVSAFEVLLDIPEEGQRKFFKEEVERLTNLPNERQYTYKWELWDRTKKSYAYPTETRSIKGKWVDRFYTLRNHIIHGNKVRESEYIFFKQRHIDIAVLFFIVLIKKLLQEQYKTKTIFLDTVSWHEQEDGDGNKFYGFCYDDNDIRLRLREIEK